MDIIDPALCGCAPVLFRPYAIEVKNGRLELPWNANQGDDNTHHNDVQDGPNRETALESSINVDAGVDANDIQPNGDIPVGDGQQQDATGNTISTIGRSFMFVY